MVAPEQELVEPQVSPARADQMVAQWSPTWALLCDTHAGLLEALDLEAEPVLALAQPLQLS